MNRLNYTLVKKAVDHGFAYRSYEVESGRLARRLP